MDAQASAFLVPVPSPVALSKRQEVELEGAELKLLRFSLGVTRMDKIRNEFIRGTAHVGCFGDTVREARLRWFGHVQRRDINYIGRRMLRMELPGRRKRGRPKRRFMDVVREDMQVVGVKEADVEDRVLNGTLDFEDPGNLYAGNGYSLLITAVDKNDISLKGDAFVYVTVTPGGVVIGSVNATDMDLPPTLLQCSIVSGG
ncbi:hypothetical protein C0J45_24215, partial [Silurus meridionalis]